VLFDAEDQNERPLAKGLALAHSGETVDAAGLRLRPEVAAYPGIKAIAVPNVFGFAGGLIGGFTAMPGAAPTIWCNLRGMSKNEQRGLVQPYITIMQCIAIALLLDGGRCD